MSAAVPSFGDFFAAVHGFDPFPWQARLADRVTGGGWPSTIDAPTGLGKTSVIDIAVYRMAVDALRPPLERTAHSRIALVVDRRLIVDAANDHVAKIAAALADAHHTATQWVRDRLVERGGEQTNPLAYVRMRGGVNWSSLWATSPAQPVVVAGTVDQVGSRLLFRGYGTSERLRPIDAGLLGIDTLLLLDEAHLSGAFAETVAGCAALQARAPAARPRRPAQLVAMTATPATASGSMLDADDIDHPRSAARLNAVKDAVLVDVADATGTKRAAGDVGRVLARLAVHAVDAGAQTVLVVANTVDAARAAFDALDRRAGESALVIGRCRPADRTEHLGEWMPLVRTGRIRSEAEAPQVVVATQTVEVGLDLDVDALVTEIAPIDSLVQRFGRVDRAGELGLTTSWIVRVPGRLVGAPPPYGPATQATWEWLTGQVGGAEIATVRSGGERGEFRVDFGTRVVREQLAALAPAGGIAHLLAPREPPPVVTPGAARVWARTSPQPTPDEEVAAYLHGVGRGQTSVALAWRCDLDPALPVLTVPLAPHELVEVPLAAARRFLAGLAPLDGTDVEAEPEPEATERRTGRPPLAIVKRGDDWIRLQRAGNLRPGDVVVVESAAGGHDGWGFTGRGDRAVADVADLGAGLAILDGGEPVGSIRLRCDRVPLAAVIGRELRDDEASFQEVVADADRPQAERLEAAHRLIASLAASPGAPTAAHPRAVQATLDALAAGPTIVTGGRRTADDSGDVVDASAPLIVEARAQAAIDGADDGDQSSSVAIAEPARLDAHLRSVQERAAHLAAIVGLPDELVRAVTLAGRFHDLGKADVRFQGMLMGGPRWMAEAVAGELSEMFAKSRPRSRGEQRAAGRQAGWPDRYRHEAISLALVESAPSSAFTDVDRDLVEHLVASHHGCARPLFPPVCESEVVEIDLAIDGVAMRATTQNSHPGWSQPERFDRLVDRYGPWGLASLEALLRLADIGVSKEGR